MWGLSNEDPGPHAVFFCWCDGGWSEGGGISKVTVVVVDVDVVVVQQNKERQQNVCFMGLGRSVH